MLNDYLIALLKLFFPDCCYHCQCLSQTVLCDRCATRCKPFLQCAEVLVGQLYFFFDYKGPLKALIKHIKFHAHPGLITDIKSYFMSYTMPQSYDFWVSVPYHRAKINERGFNLIHGLFGEWLSQSHISYYPLLLRHNNTKPLAGLSTVERKKVLSNVFSFQLSPMRITGKRILIVDDIYTTGTTVTQIQQLLACYEPKKVDILCLCKTPINTNRSQ